MLVKARDRSTAAVFLAGLMWACLCVPALGFVWLLPRAAAGARPAGGWTARARRHNTGAAALLRPVRGPRGLGAVHGASLHRPPSSPPEQALRAWRDGRFLEGAS